MLYGYNLLSKFNNNGECIPNVSGVYGDGGKRWILWFVVIPIPKLFYLVLSDGGTGCIVNFFFKTVFYLAKNSFQ